MMRLGARGRLILVVVLLGASAATVGCSELLDIGSDRPRGLLPVDQRNPLIVYNDGAMDNWQGEYAMALASAGQLDLVGIIVTTGHDAPSIATNVMGWTAMANAARTSGMGPIPDPTASNAPPLQRPANGNIQSTSPNGSPGAHLIVDTARQLGQPFRPIVVATGGALTDIADAYLLDPTIADRVVVVATLGSVASDGKTAIMGPPNGTTDPWADEIVARELRYVQLDAYYNQTTDITAQKVTELPANPFGAWIAAKQPKIVDQALPDQISIMASAIPTFALNAEAIAADASTPTSSTQVPTLQSTDAGTAWLVTRGDAVTATALFWQIVTKPGTYHP